MWHLSYLAAFPLSATTREALPRSVDGNKFQPVTAFCQAYSQNPDVAILQQVDQAKPQYWRLFSSNGTIGNDSKIQSQLMRSQIFVNLIKVLASFAATCGFFLF